ncbi:MAG: glycoside hydrolase family 5 protein [Lachnospiraceae bacterium]|nr:glycoside hydrolase family 5 protein [Lachnospiraceae bacterium]
MLLNRGVNLGGFLSQCDHKTVHYDCFMSEWDIKRIANWGFDHVRLPIDYESLENEEGKKLNSGYDIIKNIISWCEEYNLSVVLDLHKTYGYTFDNAGDSLKNNLFREEELKVRFLNLWKEIASTFKSYKNVAFELLNEVVEESNSEEWNKLIKRAIETVRSVAPDNYIIYGGIQWNSAKTLKFLDPPTDDKVIYTFHFYEPLLFTHQKAYWVENMNPFWTINYPESKKYYASKSEALGDQGKPVYESDSPFIGKEFLEEIVLEAVNAAKEACVGLYCGEFGVIDKAPLDATKRWFEDVDAIFRKYQIGYAIWNYKYKDFGIADAHYNEIRDDLLKLWNS